MAPTDQGQFLFLFGGPQEWSPSDWTSSDDRVRGGKSQSHLDCSSAGKARFYGILDITALGGAGFASQRTTGEDREWDLSDFDGIELNIDQADEKQFTFILKDSLLPPSAENGREQSTVSYEYDFTIPSSQKDKTTVFVPWAQLTPTYRGKKKDDAPKLDTSSIKRISLMNRSFFGTQEGNFSITVRSIKATMQPPSPTTGTEIDLFREYEMLRQEEGNRVATQKKDVAEAKQQGFLQRLLHRGSKEK